MLIGPASEFAVILPKRGTIWVDSNVPFWYFLFMLRD